jgi:hypothetical protein
MKPPSLDPVGKTGLYQSKLPTKQRHERFSLMTMEVSSKTDPNYLNSTICGFIQNVILTYSEMDKRGGPTMTESNGSAKKKSKTNHNNYVRTFRDGAVAANVFRRTAPGGFEYLDFSITRAWKVPSGKEGYSTNFFEKNREALHAVVDQACDFIATNTPAERIPDAQLTQKAA